MADSSRMYYSMQMNGMLNSFYINDGLCLTNTLTLHQQLEKEHQKHACTNNLSLELVAETLYCSVEV